MQVGVGMHDQYIKKKFTKSKSIWKTLQVLNSAFETLIHFFYVPLPAELLVDKNQAQLIYRSLNAL